MRSDHPDSKYVFTIFQYLKELAIKFRDNVIMVCAETKQRNNGVCESKQPITWGK